MSATATQPMHLPTQRPPQPGSRKNGNATISWEAFQRRYLSREDEYKYEWVEGKTIKTKRDMDKSQLFILHNLQKFFRKLLNEGKAHGELVAEPDLFFIANHRRPDFAWLTSEQIYRLAQPDGYEVPAFIIEVISTNDQVNKVKEKMKNYREAGVQVVWQIFPKMQEVDVYAGHNLEDMTTCSGQKLCSAAPALPDFALPAADIFQIK